MSMNLLKLPQAVDGVISAAARLRTINRGMSIELTLLSTLAAVWCLSSTATAQNAAGNTATSEPATSAAVGLEEIIVTAQRRSESVQTVPISVNVLSSSDISSKGIASSNDLTGTVPSLNISTQGEENYTLRGVGTNGSGINQEQSVALYLDGVYLYDPWASNFPLNSIDRVEVLYGPQGTLFGRNTTGGVIQYISRDPSVNALEASVGYANFQTTTEQFYAGGKLSDDLAANVSVNYRNQGQGWGFDTYLPNEKFDFTDYLSFQTKAVFTPVDGTKVTGLFWYNNTKSSGLNSQLMPGEFGVNGVQYNLQRYEYVANTEDSDREKSYLGYVRLDQDLGFAKFVSISSFRKVDGDFHLDQDTTPLTVVNSELVQPVQNLSQEIQLLSPDSSANVKWLVGAYYFDGRAGYRPATIAGLAAAPLPDIEFFQTQTTNSGALFGQTTFKVVERTNLTVGLRYTDETEHEVSHTSSSGEQLFANPDQKTDSSGLTGRVSLDHEFTDDVMGYASYNRGLKSGGFSLVTATNLPAYKPEHLDAYEVGMKSEFFDNRLRVNAAAFLYDYKDIQVESIVAGGTVTNNAAAATIKGVDLDIRALPFQHLTVTGSLGYLDSYYDSFPNAAYFALNPFAAAPAGVTCPAGSGTVAAGASQCAFNARGKVTDYAPRFSATLGEDYKVPSPVGDFTFSAFAKYVGTQYVAPDNLSPIPTHTLVNTSLSWQPQNSHYSVRLWADNVFDRRYLNDVLEEAVGYLQVQGDPRTFGITFTAKY
jgi:iron complex outermembrane receptor protein